MKNKSDSIIKNERKKELKQVVKSLIPKFIININKIYKNKKKFPDSFISVNSYINFNNNLNIGGKNLIHRDVTIDVKKCTIGKFTTISGPTQIVGLGEVKIGEICSIAPDVYIVTNNHNYNKKITYPLSFIHEDINDDHIVMNVNIGDNVWIGKGVIILPGVTIGDNCIIGAGAVLTKGNYESDSIIGGIPAKVICKRKYEVKEYIANDR